MKSRCLFTVPINNSWLEWLLCMEQLHSATAGLYFFSNDMKSTSIYQLNYSFRSSHHRCKPGLMNTIRNWYLTCTGGTDHFIWACSGMTAHRHCSSQKSRNQISLIHDQNTPALFGWDVSLQWLHNGSYGVSNHQPHDCLLSCLFRQISKKTSKLRVTGLCKGKSPVTGDFPAKTTSNAENVSIWWRHHGCRLAAILVLGKMSSLRSFHRSKSPTILLFVQKLVQFNNWKISKHCITGPLCRESSDNWIPLEMGQWCRKHFNVTIAIFKAPIGQ